jgi:hypothetical protein
MTAIATMAPSTSVRSRPTLEQSSRTPASPLNARTGTVVASANSNVASVSSVNVRRRGSTLESDQVRAFGPEQQAGRDESRWGTDPETVETLREDPAADRDDVSRMKAPIRPPSSSTIRGEATLGCAAYDPVA